MPHHLCVACSAILLACSVVACGDTESYRDASEALATRLPDFQGVSQFDQALQPAHGAEHTPMVLLHGMAGFRPVLQRFDYFYGVRRAFVAAGYPVFCTQVDPFQTVPYRAMQLAGQVDQILRETGADRVHLLAHSQGGLDARYLISTLGYGDRVATLTTVGTPHHGVRFVDELLARSPRGILRGVTDAINAISNALLGGKSDLLAQLQQMSEDYVEGTFNPQNPDDPRVAYYSYAGLTQAHPWVDRSKVDIVNPMLLPSYTFIRHTDGDNDGIVPTQSARWGTFLGTLAADHWDQLGQLPGMPHPSFSHLPFYSNIATFLESGGDPPIF